MAIDVIDFLVTHIEKNSEETPIAAQNFFAEFNSQIGQGFVLSRAPTILQSRLSLDLMISLVN